MHVALKNRDEFEALEQRHRVVEGLGEHAFVETEPGKFTVLGVIQITLLVVSVVAHDGSLVLRCLPEVVVPVKSHGCL